MISFLGMSRRTSGEIRGRQVAERMGGSATFTDVHNPDWHKIERNKIVLFCRTWEGGLAAKLARKGFLVGYDVADMPIGDAVFRNADVPDLGAYAHPECSFFVVNNEAQKLDLQLHTDKPTFVLPHHSANFDGFAAPFRSKPQRVGYVGLPEQLSAKGDIEALCAEFGVEFVSVHPETREECDRVFRSLDVGVVFADDEGALRPRVVELVKRYKPNTKLTNFQSYGLPTVCTPYQSYLEFGEGACRFVDSKEEMLLALKGLLGSARERATLGAAAYGVGRKFGIDALIRDRYAPMVEELMK